MAENAGFLERLTGPGNEEQIAGHVIANDIKSGGRLAQMMYGLGQQAAGGLGPVAAGAISGLTGGRIGGEKGAGFKANFARGATDATDGLTAQANGITKEELQARRQIRKEIAGMPDDGTHASRIAMAERAVQVAQALGEPQSLNRALQTLQDTKIEAVEFDRLNAETTTKLGATGYRSDGTQVGGTLGRDPETGLAGMFRPGPDGPIFEAFGENLLRVDPSKFRGSLGEALRNKITPSAMKGITDSIVTNLSTMRKSQRVIDTLFQLGDRANSIMAASGNFLSATDNIIRNVGGVIDSFRGGYSRLTGDPRGAGVVKTADGDEYWSGAEWWSNKANDAADSIWSFFPESVREDSAAAQQHRAQILELAYMAARIAEPSNRGLSDNDIKYALQRIAGDTSNPQVMVRRFVESIGDALFEVDARIDSYHVPGYTREEIARELGGESYFEMKRRRDKMFDTYGITMNEVGRATLAGPQLGSDIQPTNPDGPSVDVVEGPETTSDFEARIFGTKGE